MNAYIRIARPDYWVKNIFVLPGVVLALFFRPELLGHFPWWRFLAGMAVVCLVASSNYVINEILDAPQDRFHPVKRNRPIPSGEARVATAWLEWVLLSAAGLGAGFAINRSFGICALLLWLAGLAYNVRPIRLKELVYADVLSESLNNPLRMALGWYMAGVTELPPVSLLFAYWMFGAFLMGAKRFAEYRSIADPEAAARYRRSFAGYNEERLLESLFFYGVLFGLMSGFFMARYHLELILAAPFVAYAVAYYLHLMFKPDSAAQYPERLWKEKKLIAVSALAFAACTFFLLTDIPIVSSLTAPTHRKGPLPMHLRLNPAADDGSAGPLQQGMDP